MAPHMVNGLLDAVFPNDCVLCGLRGTPELPLCASCRSSFSPNRRQCRYCALPLPDSPATVSRYSQSCAQCIAARPNWRRVIAPWLYDEQMAYLIRRWKFHGERRLTPLLAALWLQGNTDIPRVDAIVPVPLHWWRLCRRGFNQSQLLCQQLRKQSPTLRALAMPHRIIRRNRATRSQAQLTVDGRGSNLEGAFDLLHSCAGLRVAVVDDVMTTGSTAGAISRALLEGGATSVDIWCIARTPAPPNSHAFPAAITHTALSMNRDH
jgi:ComF family protein